MSVLRKSSRVYALLIMLLLALLAVSKLAAPTPPSPRPSFDNPGPQGLLALRLVLEQIPEFTVDVSSTSSADADKPVQAQNLLITEPTSRPFSKDEAQAILEQVRAGGRLLLLYNGMEGASAVGLQAFSQLIGLEVIDITPENTKIKTHGGIMRDVERLDDYVFSVFAKLPPGAISLAQVPNKGSVLVAMRYGQGQILALSQLQFFDNAHLADDDNARLAVQLLAPKWLATLQVDETHHLALNVAPQKHAFDHAAFRAFALGLALCALLFAMNRRRRGQLRRPVNRPGFHALANARALASLYRDSADLKGLNRRLDQLAQKNALKTQAHDAKNLKQWQQQMQALLRKIKS